MAKTQVATLELTCNTKRVKQELKEYERLATETMQKLAQLTDALNLKKEQGLEITNEELARLKKLEENIKLYTSAQQKGVDEMVRAREVMNNLSKSSIKEVNRAIRELTSRMNGLRDVKGIQRVREQIDKLKASINEKKGLAMSFQEAQAQLKKLDGTSMEHLKQGLAAIKAQLDNPNIGNKWRRSLQEMQGQYQAAIASRNVPIANQPVALMNSAALKAEQAALTQAVTATSGVKGYEQKNAAYVSRLKEINNQLKLIAENEKLADDRAKQLQATQQAAQTVRSVYRGQVVSLEELNKAYATLEARAKQFAGINPAKAKAATQQMTLLRQRILDVTRAMNGEIKIDKQFLKNATNEQLHNALSRLQQKLQMLSSTQGKAASKIKQDMAAIERQIKNNTGAIQKQANTFGTAIKNIAAYVGVFGAFNMIKSKVMSVYQSNLKLSDSLANIRKVSGLTSEEINKLYLNISKIDSRNTIETLNQLAYTGAKLGIGQNYGVQGLTGFVKAAEQVQMALGEDLGEEALPALAKLTEVMNLIPKYGVEQAMQKSASAIFQLGATSTATGKNIVEFSKRLMGLANVSRISADELLGIASASDALGIMPEVGATAFNKLFTSIQKNHNLIEKTLGLAQGSINENFSKGKTINSIIDIFESMNKKGNMNALDGIFKDLGSDGARLVAVMTTMADRVDILKKHIATSTEAFRDGTAVINEYMIQNETAAALMDRASNLWAKAFTNPEGVDMVKQLAEKWYEVSKALTQSESSMYAFHDSLEKITNTVVQLVKILPFLIKMLTWLGVFGGIRMLVNSFWALFTAINAARTAAATFQAVMNSNVVLAGLAAVAGGISLFIDELNAAAEKAEMLRKREEELNEQLLKSKENINKVATPMLSYKKALDQSNKSLDERNKLLKDLLKSEYQDYLDYLGIEIDGAYDLAKAYAMVVKVLKQKKAYEEREQFRDETNSSNKYDRMRAGMQFGQASKAIGANLDQEWLRQRYNLSTESILSSVVAAAGGSTKNVNLKGVATNVYYDKNGNLISKAALDRIRKTIGSYRTSRNAENIQNRDVDDMFKDLVGDFDMEKFQEEVVKGQLKRKGNLSNLKPDKDELKKQKQAAQDYKQALRKDLKDAKEESDAIISKIEEWYRLQESVITGMAADGKLTQEQAEQATRTLNIAKNTALRDARLAISGRNTEAWEKTKQQIGTLMIDQGEWSKELLAQILDVSMSSIRANLSRIDKGGGQFGITTSSLRDAVDKNAAGNQREINRIMNKSAEEVEKLLEKYNYLEQATKAFATNLTQIGALTITAEQIANGLTDLPGAKATNDATMSLLVAMMQQGTKLFSVNPSDAEGVAGAIRSATTINGEQAQWFDMFPAIKDWMENPEQHKKELENFFNVVLIAERDYYAKRKQSYDNAKKLQDNRFRAAGYTDTEERTDTALQNEAQMQDAGVGASFWQQQGLGGIANDPEVQRIQNRIYWRNEEVKAAEASLAALKAKQAEEVQALRDAHASKEEIQRLEAEHDAARMGMEDLLHEKKRALFEQETNLTTKVAQELQKRIQTINSLTKPVQDAANSVGKKLGEMIRGAEEESITWDEIWRNMAIAVGESVIDMMAAYAQNLIMEKAMNSQSKQESVEKAEVDVAAGIASGSAKTIGTLGWWGIALIPVIAALLKGLLSEALSTAGKGNNSNNTKVKLVSGMLTYDEGNVGQYVGNDGHVYSARQQSSLPEGVSVVNQPIATTVNGQPALVGEKGPEIVIGRKTSRRIMMNEPGLLQRIAQIERGGRFFTRGGVRMLDSGNLEEVLAIDPTSGSSPARGGEYDKVAAALEANSAALAAFTQLMGNIQQKGIPAKMAAFGDGSLDEGMRTVTNFRKKYPQ